MVQFMSGERQKRKKLFHFTNRIPTGYDPESFERSTGKATELRPNLNHGAPVCHARDNATPLLLSTFENDGSGRLITKCVSRKQEGHISYTSIGKTTNNSTNVPPSSLRRLEIVISLCYRYHLTY